jgi:hypothetical protein
MGAKLDGVIASLQRPLASESDVELRAQSRASSGVPAARSD